MTDTICQECGGPNPVWLVDNEIWNAVMGDEGGILCPTCFMIKADDGHVIWKVSKR